MAQPDEHIVPILEQLARDAPAVDEHAVGAVEILDDRVPRPGEDDGVAAADAAGLDPYIVVGRSADAGPATEYVDDLAAVSGLDQQAQRALGQRLSV